MAIEFVTLKKKMAKFGSRFLFEWTIEMMHDKIVQGLRQNLTSIKADDIPAMVRESRFPPLEHLDLSIMADNTEYLESITELRLLKLLGEARPDIANAIMEMDVSGAEYIVRLRAHLLGMVKHPEKALSESTDYKPELVDAEVIVRCDKCMKTWSVKKSEVSEIGKCPFCNAGKDN